MATTNRRNKKLYSEIAKKKKDIINNIFNDNIDFSNVSLSILDIDKNIDKTLLEKLKYELEGKCSKNGLIKKDTIKIINYSPGNLQGSNVIYHVNYNSLICNPVEGMVVDCYVKNITKAGIRAELNGYQNTDDTCPIVVFIARDHNFDNEYFTNLNTGDIIKTRIIGSRFVLNDLFISCIAELIYN